MAYENALEFVVNVPGISLWMRRRSRRGRICSEVAASQRVPGAASPSTLIGLLRGARRFQEQTLVGKAMELRGWE